MEKIEILRKALMKAKKQGYFLAIDMDTIIFHNPDVVCFNDVISGKDFLKGTFSYYKIIFNHDFAQAFWGQDWQKHLQNMVILREPLEYLKNFVS